MLYPAGSASCNTNNRYALSLSALCRIVLSWFSHMLKGVLSEKGSPLQNHFFLGAWLRRTQSMRTRERYPTWINKPKNILKKLSAEHLCVHCDRYDVVSRLSAGETTVSGWHDCMYYLGKKSKTIGIVWKRKHYYNAASLGKSINFIIVSVPIGL